MSHTYPDPVELTGDEIEIHEFAKRLGRAVSEQHPGPQISEDVLKEGGADVVNIRLAHPAGDWTLFGKYRQGVPATTIERDALEGAMTHYLRWWNSRLTHVIQHVQATNADGADIPVAAAYRAITALMARAKNQHRKFIFIGNGGSSGIASHMAEDFTKNGGVRGITFADPALLSCYANDYGWPQAMAKAVQHYGDAGDVLVAISSSGASENIRNAVAMAKTMGIVPVTLSGFDAKNPLRGMGSVNLWVPSQQYGFVETAHAALLHSILDISNGWVGQP